MEVPIMKEIKVFEEVKRGKKFPKTGINKTLFWGYERSKNLGNETINFYELVWDNDVDPIIEICRASGFEYITISSPFSGLIATLAEFEKRGCRVGGLTTVKAWKTETGQEEDEYIPAIIVHISKEPSE